MAMRCSLVLLMLALAGVPALAQEGMRPGNPGPIEAAPKAAPKTAKHHAVHHRRHRRRVAMPAAGQVPLPKPTPRAVVAKAAPPAASAKVPLPQKAPQTAVAKAAPPAATGSVPLPQRSPLPDLAAPVTAGFAGVPVDERWRIQSALAWAGDFSGDAQGEDPLVAAIKHYQKRHKAKVTGTLTPAQRAALLAADRHHQNEFGWSVVVDPATGIRIGLPTKLVPHAHDAARGTRWSSPHGAVQVETFRIKDPDLKLSDLFAQEKSHPRTRRVAHSVLHDDSFFISGMQGLKYFSVRAEQRDGEVRGFTLLYDQAMRGIVAPVMVAMASAFAPFPERSAPFAALAKSVEYGTGLIVSATGHIVTARRLVDACQVIVVPGLGDAVRLAEDQADGLALLRVYGQHKLSALRFAAKAPKAAELTLLGIPDPKEQNGRRKLIAIKAQLAGTAIELRQPVPVAGFAGAAALDAKGDVLGMMATRNAVVASNAPAAPPVSLVRGPAIRAFLDAQGVAAAKAPAAEARDAVVRVICVRK